LHHRQLTVKPGLIEKNC